MFGEISENLMRSFFEFFAALSFREMGYGGKGYEISRVVQMKKEELAQLSG